MDSTSVERATSTHNLNNLFHFLFPRTDLLYSIVLQKSWLKTFPTSIFQLVLNFHFFVLVIYALCILVLTWLYKHKLPCRYAIQSCLNMLIPCSVLISYALVCIYLFWSYIRVPKCKCYSAMPPCAKYMSASIYMLLHLLLCYAYICIILYVCSTQPCLHWHITILY